MLVKVATGSNTASQMQRTVGIHELLFHNYWFDNHKIWPKLSRGAYVSRYRNFHKNTRRFTYSYKTLKTNLILKKRIVSYLEHKQIELNIWHQFLFWKDVILLRNYIVFKIENIPPIKFFKITNKKPPLLFREECIRIGKGCWILWPAGIEWRYSLWAIGVVNGMC